MMKKKSSEADQAEVCFFDILDNFRTIMKTRAQSNLFSFYYTPETFMRVVYICFNVCENSFFTEENRRSASAI